jgi:hypothetical protein
MRPGAIACRPLASFVRLHIPLVPGNRILIMADVPNRPARTFTVKEANAALPLIRAIVSDLVRLAGDVMDRRQRLSALSGGGIRSSHDPYGAELVQIEEELDKDGLQLQEYVEELRQIGVEPKSATEGLVDFPTLIEGRSAFLCWKLGEPEVAYWHELSAGFRGRQPLAVASESSAESGQESSDPVGPGS